DDPSLVVRVQAAQALWNMERNYAELIPVLIDLIGVESPNVGLAAASILGQMRVKARTALPALRRCLAASEYLDRLLFADAISRIDPLDRDAQSVLIDGLFDAEADVRYLAAVALGDAPLSIHRKVEKELTGALDDRNLRVQGAAAQALDQLRAR